MYYFYLGGKNNNAMYQGATAEVEKAMPDIFNVALENRSFLHRFIRYMLGQGIMHIIDIGSGLPTITNTHKVAHSVNPTAKVVCVDMNPTVLEHGTLLLEANRTTTIICEDICQP